MRIPMKNFFYFPLLVVGVSCLFLFSQQGYKKQSFNTILTTVNLLNRITYSEYSDNEKPTMVSQHHIY